VEELATVYARSLFEAADDAGRLDEVREQLGQLADALDADRDLQVFFFSPYLSAEEKKDGAAKAVTGADDLVRNFLDLLIENQRVPALFGIRREYDALWEHENKLLPVQVVSATELDPAIVDRIGDRIAEQTGQKVELSSAVDPDVLGGLVVRVGNTVLDASVRNRLENLRREVARS
jgi:F-type H+-transporting ATPase subunit delta